MKKRLKSISLLLTISIIAATFSGCRSSKNASEDSSKPVTLKFAVWDYSKSPEYKQTIDAFQTENPNIKVEPLDISSAEYSDKVKIMLTSGDKTDLIALKSMPDYSGYSSKNQILALDDYVAKDKLDLKNYNGTTDGIKLNNKLYGIPYRSDYWVLFYNKDLFDKAKEPYPTNDMTWQQFRDKAKKMTSGDGANKVYGAYEHIWKSAIVDWAVANKKGTLTDGKYEFLKPTYDIFLPMQNEDKSIMAFGTAKASSAHYSGQFETGKCSMVLIGSWFVGTLISDKKAGKHNINWGMVSAPHFEGSKAGATFGNVTPIGINSASDNKSAAWKFVKFISGEKGATIFAKNGVMPAYRDTKVMDTYTGIDGFPSDSKDALKTSSVAVEFPPNVNGAQIDKILQEEHELIMIGKNSVDVGIANMNKRVQEVLNNK